METVVENSGQISDFFAPVKLGKGWAKCLTQYLSSAYDPISGIFLAGAAERAILIWTQFVGPCWRTI